MGVFSVSRVVGIGCVVLSLLCVGVNGGGQMNPLPYANIVNSDVIIISASNPDTTPPTLTNFTVVSPAQPSNFNSISFILAMSDAGVGVAAFFVHVFSGSSVVLSTGDTIASCTGCQTAQALYYTRCDCTQGTGAPVSTPWANGDSRSAALSWPYSSRNGTYDLLVQVVDRMGNIANYNQRQLAALGFQSRVSIWSSTVVDSVAPQLDSVAFTPFSFGWVAPTPTFTLPLSVTLNVSDNANLFSYQYAFRPQRLNPVRSGNALMTATFPQPLGQTRAGSVSEPDDVESDPAFPSGQYDLSVVVTDYQQNKQYYSAAEISLLGFSSTLLLTGGSPDHVAPTCRLLAPLVATPSTANPSVISFDGAAFCADDDAGSGLAGYDVIIQGPGPNPMQYTVSGQPGVPAQLHMFLDNSLPGLYRIVGLIVWDKIGNVRGYGNCASWVVNQYQTSPGLDKFDPTLCDLEMYESSSSIVRAGWIVAVCLMGLMFLCVLILSINQCHRDGACDCCCSCCSCCYKSNYVDKLETVKLSIGPSS